MNDLGGPSYLTRKRKQAWRDATQQSLEQLQEETSLPYFERPLFTFLPVYQRQLPDPGAIAPTTKAIIDGVVALGLIEDDSFLHTAGILQLPPVQSTWTGVTVKMAARPAALNHLTDRMCSCREDMQRAQRANEHKRQQRLKQKLATK